ncbi:hypothetical protein EDD21DRAFT_364168 [Dissophora ornata]|nr:hypothetical protein EDD21DRAFT_364168 [Dissophora ornata]
MAAPPLDSSTAIHGAMQTTTDTPVPAPEVLLTRPYEKRSLAAMEPEFVDNNDINGMAPSSAILQSDFLIMDDANNLEDKVDMSHKVGLTHKPMPPASKRVRYTTQENEPTSSDYAQIEPIIQPADKTNSAARRPSSSRSGSHSTMSRRRSIADLVHPSRHHPPVYVDEPESTAVCGEPVDSSSATFPLDNSVEEQPPTPALTSTYPGSSSVAAGGSFNRRPSKGM